MKRADSVKKYLLERQGISENRAIIKAYGENEPVASNNSEEGRALNRRVDIIGAELD